jgi:LCP family protein required for cell wall assembly
VATLSIPRDLYVEIPTFGWRKINNALAFGRDSDYPGGGEALLASVASKVIGQPINYYARIDFEGFRKVIDDLGGIDIYVDNSFDDYEYPDYNHGFQHISFKQGWDHMSGERALQYVRSRHGTNGEGSDFSRSRRQQKVLLTMKDKMFSLNTITNPASVVSILNDLGNHNQTNLQIWEMLKLSKLVQNVKKDQLITRVLDTSPEGLLKSSYTADGAYILQPKSGNFLDIQYLAKNIFNTSYIARENATIAIQNGTRLAGLGTKISEQLQAMQFNVASVGNTKDSTAYPTTTIYDLSSGQNPYTLSGLKDMLGATVSTSLPDFLTGTNTSNQVISNNNINAKGKNADFLIIIGSDLESTSQLTSRATAPLKKDL